MGMETRTPVLEQGLTAMRFKARRGTYAFSVGLCQAACAMVTVVPC